jgi:hypothetical protein
LLESKSYRRRSNIAFEEQPWSNEQIRLMKDNTLWENDRPLTWCISFNSVVISWGRFISVLLEMKAK